MTAVLAELFESPTLPDMADAIAKRLGEEAERRQRFYAEIPDDQKAEFINGEVIVHSPAKRKHLSVRDNLHELLRAHVRARKLGLVCGEKALCAFPRNDYEPDICFFAAPKAALIAEDTVKFPVPDLVVEVLSDSTAQRDRGVKFQDYEAHGVREYWIIDPDEEVVEQYLIGRDGRFQLKLKSGSGEVASPTIAGLVLPIRAIFEEAETLKVLKGWMLAADSH